MFIIRECRESLSSLQKESGLFLSALKTGSLLEKGA